MRGRGEGAGVERARGEGGERPVVGGKVRGREGKRRREEEGKRKEKEKEKGEGKKKMEKRKGKWKRNGKMEKKGREEREKQEVFAGADRGVDRDCRPRARCRATRSASRGEEKGDGTSVVRDRKIFPEFRVWGFRRISSSTTKNNFENNLARELFCGFLGCYSQTGRPQVPNLAVNICPPAFW